MKKMILLGLLALGGVVGQPAMADTAACQIWSCLPTGFSGQCGNAYTAMKNRMAAHKAPLPNKAGCQAFKNTGKGFDYRITPAAFVPSKDGEKGRWVQGAECLDYFGIGPKGCVKRGEAITVTQNGQPIGEPFFTGHFTLEP